MRPELEIIALKPGDEVVGAATRPDDAELVFVTSDAQLLRFPAAAVRPQGAPAGGMAGIKLGGKAEAIAFSVARRGPRRRRGHRLRGGRHDRPARCGPRARSSRLPSSPAKGRATGGVRAHAFLKGEDGLTLAWVGAEPALAVRAGRARARALPERRQARRVRVSPSRAVIGSIGTTAWGMTGAIMLVSGLPGVGKTTVAREMALRGRPR